MRTKTFIGAALATTLVGVGVLAGSIMGADRLSAQTPPATSTQSTPTATAVPKAPGVPNKGFPDDRHPGREMKGGRGPGKHGGPGRGPLDGATADDASAAISSTNSLVNLIKADLAYANGKMVTADAERWVSGAETLLGTARTASGNSQYGQAVSYAHAAHELALVAYSQMAQELGADTLPSYNQLPQRRMKGMPANTTVTQAQASRVLASSYDHLIMLGAVVSNASNAGQAATYMTDAQDAYRDAYNAYQAGNYTEAVQAAKLSAQLAEVSGILVGASNAPSDQDTPVTVPAPNF